MKKTYIAPEAKIYNITKTNILDVSSHNVVSTQQQLVNEERSSWSSSGSSVWDTEW